MMKKYLLFSLIVLWSSKVSFSQIDEYECVIARDDYTSFYVITADADTVFLTNDSIKTSILKPETSYKIINGKGRKKDSKGVREKNKKYLVSSNKDTLLTIANSTRIEILDSIAIRRETTSNGWNYIDQSNNVISKVDLFWNDSLWKYNVKNYKSGEVVDALNRLIMLSFVNMASSRSACDCSDSEDDSSFWFIMWAASMANSN